MRSLGRLSLGILLPCAVFAQSQNDPVRAPAGKNANDPIYAEGYIKPPDAVARLVAAPRSSNFTWGNPSPTRKYLLHAYTEEPVLEFLGKRHYNLGGWQIDPAASRSRSMTYRNTSGYDLLDWATGKTIKVQLPAGARGSTFTSWSPDGSTFAYFAQFPDATHIYLADPATGVSRPLTKVTVVATNVENFAWTADGKSIVTVLAADNRGPEPKEPVIADGIRVRVNENNTLKTRNYPDLLDGPFEQTLFEYYNMGQLALIDVKTRVVTKVGEPGPITRLDPSPDAKFFRVTYIDRPFSYVLPTSSFGTHEVIIDGTGKVLKEMAKRPLREGTASDIVDPNDPNGGQQGGGGFGGRGGGGGEQDTVHRGLTWHPFESGLMFMRSAREDSTVRADSIKAAAANRATRGGRGGAGGNGGRGGRGGGGGGGARGGGGAGGGPGADSTAARPDTLFLWTAPFVGPNSSILKPLYVTKG
ncbi:MAG TPA: hypothetical protein VE967_07535, partial [Gemmatimonadaceae bacterium]|nr:hypothetical protein [Gemmatimonadaceae bacterium]